jgi:3-hydroxyisobutyrate dehydrogenase-like beta-hydroxyacid dehydrogenase
MTRRNTPRVSFIGFGEAGQAMAAGLREDGIEQVAAWDILLPKPEGEELRKAGETMGVRVAGSAADAVRGSEVIISAVTAASSYEAAQSVAPHLEGHPFYLDVNSVSPGRKRATAELLSDRARYIDVAILSPIYPARHQSPMLLAGPHVEAVAPILQALAMKTTVAGPETGAAAAIKMVRGVIIKGIEALTAECFIAAERAGIVKEVADSLKNNYPTLNWDKVIAYNLERMASHGERRAAEMEEVAETLRELGVDPLMVTSTVKRQREMGAIGKHAAVRSTLKNGHDKILPAVSAAAGKKK